MTRAEEPQSKSTGRVLLYLGAEEDVAVIRNILAGMAAEGTFCADIRELNATLESRVTQRTAELRHRSRQLQKLTLETSAAENRERERLAHILHDDLQQELAAAKSHLGIVRTRGKCDASVREIITKVEEMLKDAIGKSRSLSHELSPVVLQQGDFTETLRWLARQMQAKHGLAVHVHGRAQLPSNGGKTFLYRTAQELLFNAVKHAQVREVRLRIRPCGGYVCLSVSDRGRRFEPAQLRETTGFGLLSIRERIELLGGRMKIRSTPGKGSPSFVVVSGPRATCSRPRPARNSSRRSGAKGRTPSGILRNGPSASTWLPRAAGYRPGPPEFRRSGPVSLGHRPGRMPLW